MLAVSVSKIIFHVLFKSTKKVYQLLDSLLATLIQQTET